MFAEVEEAKPGLVRSLTSVVAIWNQHIRQVSALPNILLPDMLNLLNMIKYRTLTSLLASCNISVTVNLPYLWQFCVNDLRSTRRLIVVYITMFLFSFSPTAPVVVHHYYPCYIHPYLLYRKPTAQVSILKNIVKWSYICSKLALHCTWYV